MRLVSCKGCHAQYDVSTYEWQRFSCHCGAMVEISVAQPVLHQVVVHNCSTCGAPMAPGVDACGYCRAAVEYDERKLSLICPECFARNTESSSYCRGCGVSFHPEQLEADPVGLDCPVCKIEMRRRAVVGHPADECPKCEGLWIRTEYFAALVNLAVAAHKKQLGEHPFQPDQAVQTGAKLRSMGTSISYRLCPTCTTVMHRKNFERVSGIIVDECGDHGTWLDADELESIAAFIATGGLKKADAYKKRLAAEQNAALKASSGPSMGGAGWTTNIPHDKRSMSSGLLADAVASTLVDMVEALIKRVVK